MKVKYTMDDGQVGKKYIVTLIDYFSKWPEAEALANNNADSVARFIYLDLFSRHVVLKINLATLSALLFARASASGHLLK